MKSFENDTLEIGGIDQLLKAFKGRQPVARVGVLGGKTIRTADEKKGPTNAEVGAAHEYGTSTLPQRSFLRVPITDNLQKELESSGALDKDTLAQVVKVGSIVPWLQKVKTVAEGIVAEAFASGGYGKWPQWKTPGYTNNAGQILVDTTQLRNSITSDIKE